MSQSKNVVFDIDGVLADSHVLMAEAVNERYGTSYQVGDLIRWGFLVNEISKLSQGYETIETIRPWLFGNHLMEKAPPTPGSQKLIENLAKVGFSVHAATSRYAKDPEDQTEMTRKWLERHFPQIESLTIGGDLYGRFEVKLKAIRKHNALAYFEDDGQVISDFFNIGLSEDTFLGLIDKPWNRDFPINGRGPRIRRFGFWPDNDYEWDQVFDLLCSL